MKLISEKGGIRERGFSLVEILVGVLIGMIGIIVIFQMLATAEERKRSTASGTDAQITGAVALQTIERDIRLSGYGFSTSAYIGCTVNAYDAGRPGGSFDFTLAPVQITQGVSGAPDTITTLWGNSPLFVASQTFSSSTNTSKRTESRSGVQIGDLLVIANSTSCALIEITGNTNADGVTVDHAAGSYTNLAGSSTLSRYNPGSGVPGYISGFYYNLGNGPRRNIWVLRNHKTLTVTNDLMYSDANGDGSNDWLEISDGAIDLQADYGIDANGDNKISSSEWTTTNPVNWSKVRAVRVALLLRSGQYERAQVTTAAPAWAGGSFVMSNVDGTPDTNPASDNNWRNYRYRVYETVIPLRNMLWGTAP